MAKVLNERTQRKARGTSKKPRRAAALPRASSLSVRKPLGTSKQVRGVTAEQYPEMTERGRAFLRLMDANPHVQRAIKDLADK